MASTDSKPANADVSQEDIEIGKEYDKNRLAAAEKDDSKELGENRKLQAGVVVTGTEVQGTRTLLPGAVDRFDGVEQATDAGVAYRASKGLSTDDVTAEDTTWTAQSALPYVSSNAEDVPGQTFRVDELPDPRVMAASGLPAHAIPASLVVDDAITDSLNTSQERGGDLGTSPKKGAKGETVPAQQVREQKLDRNAKGDNPAS